MRRLMTAVVRALCDPARNGPLTGQGVWITAFGKVGQGMADLARRGRLKRSLRAVLAHHVIFHANRAGLPLAGHFSVVNWEIARRGGRSAYRASEAERNEITSARRPKDRKDSLIE